MKGDEDLRFFTADYCLRCNRPYQNGEKTRLVFGNGNAAYREVGLTVCRSCVTTEFDDVHGYPVYFMPSDVANHNTRPPVYVGGTGVKGWAKLCRLSNGAWRVGLHRGHVEIWSDEQRASIRPVPGAMAYSRNYQIYGPVDLITGGFTEVAIDFVDLSKPSPEVRRTVSRGRLAFDPIAGLEAQMRVIQFCRKPGFIAELEAALAAAGYADNVGPRARDMAAFAIAVEWAECYAWSAEMVELISVAAESLPDSWEWPVQMPSSYGFLWFAKPIADPYYDRSLGAVSWCPIGRDGDARLVVYGDVPAYRVGDEIGVVFWFASRGVAVGDLVPGSKTTAVVGEDLATWLEKCTANIRRTIEWQGKILASALSFLGGKLVVASRERAPRSLRRRGAALLCVEPAVVVVQLRRLEHQRQLHSGHEVVDWQVRWIVRGHWRQQWYPSQAKHQPVWVAPYVKGPEGKPLKRPGAEVFAVVR